MSQIEILLQAVINMLGQIKTLLTPTATQPIIYNKPVSAANTETRFILPIAVRAFTVKSRGADINIALQQNESDKNYILLPNGSSWGQDGINTYLDGFFFSSTSASAVLEIVLWRA